MNLNGKEYKAPEKVNFGILYNLDLFLKQFGSGVVQLQDTFTSGNMIEAIPMAGAAITRMSPIEFAHYVDLEFEAGNTTYEDMYEEVATEYFKIVNNNAYEGFFKFAAKMEKQTKEAKKKKQTATK